MEDADKTIAVPNEAGKTIERINTAIADNENKIADDKKKRDMLLGLATEIHQLEQLASSKEAAYISLLMDGPGGYIELLATDIEAICTAEIKHRKTTLAEAVKEIEGKNNGQ